MWGVSDALLSTIRLVEQTTFLGTYMFVRAYKEALKSRLYAITNCEPCQIWKKAALSKSSYVP